MMRAAGSGAVRKRPTQSTMEVERQEDLVLPGKEIKVDGKIEVIETIEKDKSEYTFYLFVLIRVVSKFGLPTHHTTNIFIVASFSQNIFQRV